ncbi:MAG: HAD family hydrolase [Chloroflexi bacterium]|nr:HAD family hydrolase [Chloroflexota bacterium]
MPFGRSSRGATGTRCSKQTGSVGSLLPVEPSGQRLFGPIHLFAASSEDVRATPSPPQVRVCVENPSVISGLRAEDWPHSLPERPFQKPHRRVYEIASQKLGMRASECLYVGDGGSNELQGALSVGMSAVQVGTDDEHGASRHRPGAVVWDGPRIAALNELLRSDLLS